jgi:hypothetical protein
MIRKLIFLKNKIEKIPGTALTVEVTKPTEQKALTLQDVPLVTQTVPTAVASGVVNAPAPHHPSCVRT